MNSSSDREFESVRMFDGVRVFESVKVFESVRVFEGVKVFEGECVVFYPYHVNSFRDREFGVVRECESI